MTTEPSTTLFAFHTIWPLKVDAVPKLKVICSILAPKWKRTKCHRLTGYIHIYMS